MIEILFRGKCNEIGKLCGQWIEGFYAEDDGKPLIAQSRENGIVGYFCDPNSIGQYTGLTDKNGKKIFEGDILKIYEGSEDDGYKIRKVYSYGGVLCVDYETSEWDFNALAFLDSDNVFTFEVIGNIHDNPELLEVEE